VIKSSQQGFTLIEVLVATLVLTVGILGVAAMQMVSFQTNQSAYARSQAVYLAQDMFDRMRANPSGYQTTSIYNGIDTNDSNTIPATPNCVASTSGCTATQMAQQDVREWAANFVDVFTATDYRPTLPGGRGQLTRNGSTNEFTATISWNERDYASDGSLNRTINQRSVTIVTQLN
jgi:type IV pilus assembly protein PilV